MNQLKPESKQLFSIYQEKWIKISLSTERIDRERAREAVKAAYALIEKQEPKITFTESPYGIVDAIFQAGASSVGYKLDSEIQECLLKPLRQLAQPLLTQIEEPLWPRFEGRPWNSQGSQIERNLSIQPGLGILYSVATPGNWVREASLLDFCFSELNSPCDRQRWELLQELMENAAWLYPFENVCIVCDRPVKLSVDRDNQLHADGEPAVQFADGRGLYSYHGITLPEQYGKVRSTKWQAIWLFEEYNAELRRVLIQEIGYDRMAQELHAKTLDSWREYALLKIDWVDVEPVYLLKMVCPSTGFIHALRVPPEVRSAREAIRWVNWDTDPEEFLVET